MQIFFYIFVEKWSRKYVEIKPKKGEEVKLMIWDEKKIAIAISG